MFVLHLERLKRKEGVFGLSGKENMALATPKFVEIKSIRTEEDSEGRPSAFGSMFRDITNG